MPVRAIWHFKSSPGSLFWRVMAPAPCTVTAALLAEYWAAAEKKVPLLVAWWWRGTPTARGPESLRVTPALTCKPNSGTNEHNPILKGVLASRLTDGKCCQGLERRSAVTISAQRHLCSWGIRLQYPIRGSFSALMITKVIERFLYL